MSKLNEIHALINTAKAQAAAFSATAAAIDALADTYFAEDGSRRWALQLPTFGAQQIVIAPQITPDLVSFLGGPENGFTADPTDPWKVYKQAVDRPPDLVLTLQNMTPDGWGEAYEQPFTWFQE